MFRKLLSSIGVGGATVDTRLSHDTLVPGETVSGETIIEGGSGPQEFQRIYLYVSTQYKHEDSLHEHILVEHSVGGEVSVDAGEKRTIPFSFPLPYETPLSLGRHDVYVRTGLDVPNAIDPSDVDPIRVAPHPLQQAVLDAAGNLGFRLRQVENEHDPRKGRRCRSSSSLSSRRRAATGARSRRSSSSSSSRATRRSTFSSSSTAARARSGAAGVRPGDERAFHPPTRHPLRRRARRHRGDAGGRHRRPHPLETRPRPSSVGARRDGPRARCRRALAPDPGGAPGGLLLRGRRAVTTESPLTLSGAMCEGPGVPAEWTGDTRFRYAGGLAYTAHGRGLGRVPLGTRGYLVGERGEWVSPL
ncbi:hypothetical protein GBA65_16295 [Rubrobacter marinus]|uniref:SpoOM family protein n=1 Tax=Rubrobacter marinus TaxID=2653852 RepID=A0A6G8Q044_9ACTN|nr:hypothetical protein GBA65_16295 [Rubrobacter marinus]